MQYPEFSDLTQMVDLRNRASKCYKLDDSHVFYIESGFYKALQAVKAVYPDKYQEALNFVRSEAKKNHVTVFAADENNVIVQLYREPVVITPFDVVERLNIKIEDKSRGADYGD